MSDAWQRIRNLCGRRQRVREIQIYEMTPLVLSSLIVGKVNKEMGLCVGFKAWRDDAGTTIEVRFEPHTGKAALSSSSSPPPPPKGSFKR